MTRPDRRLLDDCFLHDRDRLRHAEVLEILTTRLSRTVDLDSTDLLASAGRILARNIIAPRNVPLHSNAAVDGYAFAHRDYLDQAGNMPVSARIAAGDLADVTLPGGTAARIFTGAKMPVNADTVAMQEDCTVDQDDQVSIPTGLKPGANRRKAGEDVQEGATTLKAGTTIRPQDIAALASFGFASVKVWSRLKVAIISSGNELVRPGSARNLQPGQVFDSNFAMLQSLAATLPVNVTDCGVLPDDAAIVREQLTNIAANYDVILTTGGASRGEEDHIVTTLDELGTRHLWQIAIKPGRPMTLGQIGDCVFLGLPGNPVAAFVCFLLYARPALLRLGGMDKVPNPVRYPVKSGFSIARKKPDRREFLRGWTELDQHGELVMRKFERDGSGLISGLRQASGLIELAEARTSVAEGDLVDFLPFSEFGIS